MLQAGSLSDVAGHRTGLQPNRAPYVNDEWRDSRCRHDRSTVGIDTDPDHPYLLLLPAGDSRGDHVESACCHLTTSGKHKPTPSTGSSRHTHCQARHCQGKHQLAHPVYCRARHCQGEHRAAMPGGECRLPTGRRAAGMEKEQWQKQAQEGHRQARIGGEKQQQPIGHEGRQGMRM